MNPLAIRFLVVLLLNVIPAFCSAHRDRVFRPWGSVKPNPPVPLAQCVWTNQCRRGKKRTGQTPKLTFGAFLFYAFTPLPSNYLFIAYGLTALPLIRIALPFLLDRFVSYLLWARSAAGISSRLDPEDSATLGV